MKRLAERLVWAVLVLWAVITLTFVINNVLPGDPARMVAGPAARPADIERIRQQLGLDRPLLAQYARFMSRLVHTPRAAADDVPDKEHASCAAWGQLHIDLGKSYQQRRPVTTILAEKLPRTAMLAMAALLVQLVLGVLMGILAAMKRGTRADLGIVGVSLLGVSMPTFMLGIGLQYVFAHRLKWLPLDGFGKTPRENLLSLVLPALTLGIFGAAYYTRLVRDEMIGLLQQDYIRTALAKGASRYRAVLVHALRNALVPIVTVVALDLGALVGGAVVTETLFRWPGIGALSVNALLDRDGPVILGTVLLTSTAIVLSNVVADFLYVLLDPRIRASSGDTPR
ncbi:ABC transporter permease [Pendulispora albinea]|uniref:ABC transporter permease n=1 Tax=Pendulispora albinea TaxID=2741071 RepID=A0ABZ2LNB7_9BACT